MLLSLILYCLVTKLGLPRYIIISIYHDYRDNDTIRYMIYYIDIIPHTWWARAYYKKMAMMYERLVSKANAKSKLWTHFGFPADSDGTVIDPKKIICKLCKENIPYSGNTTNLGYHMQKCHIADYEELMKEDKDEPESTLTRKEPVQLTIDGALARTMPYSASSGRHKELLDATATFITQTLQPLHIVDEPSFRSLLLCAEPRFRLPHRTHFTDKVLPEKYEKVRSDVMKQLESMEKCTITTDLWTANYQTRSYISFTVHFLDSNFKLQSRCLQTLEVTSDHSANSLKDALASLLQSWNVTGKVCGAITDNAGNIKNAIRLLGIEHFPCVAHTLQLSIKRGLEVVKVRQVLGRCRKLVEHFQKSLNETYHLREKQEMLKLPQHKLIQECATRWGSTLDMLQRLMEQQAAIAAVLMSGKVRHLMPESDEWVIIEELVDILKPFHHATEVLSAEKYPTFSTVKPLLYKLLEKALKVNDGDTSTIKEVKKVIKSDLASRYQSTSIQKLMNVATYLDPRYKDLPFLDDVAKKMMIDDVQDELVNLDADSVETPVVSSTVIDLDSLEMEPPSKKQKGPVANLLGDLFEEQSDDAPLHCDKVAKELELYKTEKVLELDSDPLEWWNARKHHYPIMLRLVQRVFCFVATSVPSERLFSSAGNIITAKRSCLTPEHADQLIFLFENN